MKKNKYDDLGRRFLLDKNLPYDYLNYDHFQYCLGLCSMTEEFNSLLKKIEEKYEGEPNNFIHEYASVRDVMINDILDMPAYKEFIEMDMNKFAVPKQEVTSNNIFKQDNIGKMFVSIDLSKANFQAMKYVNPELVKNQDTYQDFVGQYSGNDYIKNSKYTRQVVFGKLNPKRQITVERYLIEKVKDLVGNIPGCQLVSICNDELIYQAKDRVLFYPSKLYGIEQNVKSELGIDVHVECFILHGYDFKYKEPGDSKFAFYRKVIYFPYMKHELKCVPGPYRKIVDKFFLGKPVEEMDMLALFDGCIVKFLEKFKIEEIHE